jgi:hypothetical protein
MKGGEWKYKKRFRRNGQKFIADEPPHAPLCRIIHRKKIRWRHYQNAGKVFDLPFVIDSLYRVFFLYAVTMMSDGNKVVEIRITNACLKLFFKSDDFGYDYLSSVTR